MGRTLYYGIIGKINLSDNQIDDFLALSKKYRENYDWTCESVLLPSACYLMQRDGKFKMSRKENEPFPKPDPDSIIELECLKNTLEGNYPGIEIQTITLDQIPDDFQKEEIDSSTKVGGNELNAHTVVKFVLEASKLLPERTFYLMDDADALYCPLLIKNGLAKPHLKRIEESLKFWGKKPPDNKEIRKYYNKLVNKEWEFSDINKFIRPLKNAAYLNKRESFKTNEFDVKDLDELTDMMEAFIINERLEEISYYDDIDSFPEEV